MRLASPSLALVTVLALAPAGCGEPANPTKDPQTAPTPIPSTPVPKVDNQAVPAPGQVHAAPTPADTGSSSTHATPAPNPTPVPAENPGTGNAK